jgi:hypothetical protein
MAQQGPRLYRCTLCGCKLPAWLPVAKRPDGAMLLHHLAQDHPDQIPTYVERTNAGKTIADAAAAIYEVIDVPQSGDLPS